MKVKFVSDYERSDKLLTRFKANYQIYDDSIQFTTENDYDFLVAFNRSDEPLKPGAKMITVVQEPSFSEAFAQGDSLTNSDYLIIHDRELFERVWGIKLGRKVIESPSFMFYHDRVDHSFYADVESIKKDRKLSMIVSSHHFGWANYLKRLGVLDRILQSDLDIDIYGRGWRIPDSRFKGELEFKHTGLLRYEYSVAIENSNEKNYISEKFTDCILCNTVPIYNGAPNIAEVYDEREFKQIGLDDPNIVDHIRQIISQPASGTKNNKSKYEKDLNLYSKLKEIVFSSKSK